VVAASTPHGGGPIVFYGSLLRRDGPGGRGVSSEKRGIRRVARHRSRSRVLHCLKRLLAGDSQTWATVSDDEGEKMAFRERDRRAIEMRVLVKFGILIYRTFHSFVRYFSKSLTFGGFLPFPVSIACPSSLKRADCPSTPPGNFSFRLPLSLTTRQ